MGRVCDPLCSGLAGLSGPAGASRLANLRKRKGSFHSAEKGAEQEQAVAIHGEIKVEKGLV